jgi:hypothetical protein
LCLNQIDSFNRLLAYIGDENEKYDVFFRLGMFLSSEFGYYNALNYINIIDSDKISFLYKGILRQLSVSEINMELTKHVIAFSLYSPNIYISVLKKLLISKILLNKEMPENLKNVNRIIGVQWAIDIKIQ